MTLHFPGANFAPPNQSIEQCTWNESAEEEKQFDNVLSGWGGGDDRHDQNK